MNRSALRALAATVAVAGLALTGCAGGTTQTSSAPTTSTAAAKTYKVGITQIVSHPALDATREGFKKALADAGLSVSYDEQNAENEQANATAIANKFKDAKLDLVLAIATPTAQAAANVITDTPILIAAVTDPVAAKLVASLDAPGGNVTGTTDMNPVAEQLGLIKMIKPDAKTVGIIYSSGEVNSEVQVKAAQQAAPALGLTIVTKTVTASSEVQQAANSLDVDALYTPTDNTVINALGALLQVAESKKIPVVSADADSVKAGTVITYGIDYEKLGYQTGQMGVKILKGEAQPATMPVESQKDLKVYANEAAAARMGVTIPADLLAKAEKVGK